MRDFNLLDTGSFKPFFYAAETSSFTEAARRAGLTQSGVSQHVARLESQLGVPLFLRLSRKVTLTDAGRKLRAYVEKFVEDIEVLRESIGHEKAATQGLVSYAMPASCLMSPHFPLLLEARNRDFPGVELKVTLCPSEEVIQKLAALEIDFGFVTRNTRHPAITFTPFCPEEYLLVARTRRELRGVTARTLRELRFLAHPGVDVLFDHWRDHHFPGAKRVTWESLNVVGEINSLHGVIEMVRNGLGVTILPRHCVAGLLSKGALAEHGKGALRQIYLVSIAERTRSRRVSAVVDAFLAMKG